MTVSCFPMHDFAREAGYTGRDGSLRPFLFIFVLSVFLLQTGCARWTVQSTVKGLDTSNGEPKTPVELITNLDLTPENRVEFINGRPEDEILRDVGVQLRVYASGNPPPRQEQYDFIMIAQDNGPIVGGTSNDRSFVVNNVGRVIHLTRRSGQTPQELGINVPVRIGSSMQAIVEDNDRTVVWVVNPGAANCFPPGATDCFDMETLTRELFTGIADSVENALDDDLFLSAILHRLHFVPRVVHRGHEANGRRARGFGFVYATRIQLAFGVLDVYVPISIFFVQHDQGYVLDIDPLSFEEGDIGPDSENLPRILVKGKGTGTILEVAAREMIRGAVIGAELPEGIGGADFAETILLGINQAAGNAPQIPGNYEVILLPVSDALNLPSTAIWQRVPGGNPEQLQQVRLVLLE